MGILKFSSQSIFLLIAFTICVSNPTALAEPTPTNFKVAFIGDLGINSPSYKVLQLIKDEGAQLVLHQGDFDYKGNPAAWEHMVDSILGTDFPYIGSAGNHDAKDWFTNSGYRDRLTKRAARIAGMECTGDHGVNGVCIYKGMMFITSGVGSIGRQTLPYLQGVLSQSDPFVWKVCSWHKQQKGYQVGKKRSEVPWDYYRACRENGAIIAQGHEHSYSRTHTMRDFQKYSIESKSNQLTVGPGVSFTFTQGLGGEKLRDQKICLGKDECPYWASVYAKNHGSEPASLFCTFNVDGQENKAKCYLKTITGKVIDQFSILSQNEIKPIRPKSIFYPIGLSGHEDVWVTKQDLRECE